ncbi:uncharacterized protein LOC133531850 [Cydia pomonella]|uniref:uncharacterized protein LOC133531850 n=1 Tax=Cydia pomonella TaxID=82600 RepID=UPI002ADE8DB4|nr:uncharacterized protein LOC133531850 [Cydia pomonella]
MESRNLVAVGRSSRATCCRTDLVSLASRAVALSAGENGEQKSRRRWPQQSRDLLSNGPRVACVAGCRSQCRGQRRRNPCPTKQDSGISCPDDCTDCSDFEHTGGSSNDVRKACSLDSDESYCRCPEGKVKPPKTNSLSRTDSADNKIEPTGPELVNFIRETLNKNTRDRMLLLKIEKELHALVTDTGRCNFKFPCMTSYERMLVHRVATLFQLTHHLDQNSKNSVTVSKSGTSGGRIPCTSFKQWCTAALPPGPARLDGSAKSILKRDTHSPEDANAASRAVERSKSLEQREREYERVRRRIFSTDNCSQDESQWPWLQSGPVKLLTPDSGRNKLLKVQSLEGAGPPQSWRNRGPVSKSHSFGGYGGGAENAPTNQPRLLSRQGDLASSSWRLSPSSSGYKTLSLRSTDSVTPSPTGGASPEPGAEGVVFAVADLNCVPPGALVIHPQTGRPLTNPDGSVYHFDPQNPPVIYDSYQDQKIQNCDKRRGRLEKQHSFIDTEAECRCDDGRSKCCCECRRHDGCNQRSCDNKVSVQPEQKTTPIPSSPVKHRYEQNTEQTTNQTTSPETATNHRQSYDAAATRVTEPTNQRPEIQNVQTFEPANQVPFEPQRTEFENQNQRSYEPKVFENRTHESSNQRPPSFDPLANQRAASDNATNQMTPANKLTNQESVEMPQYVPQHYHKGFRNDEVTSPPQMVQNHMMADVGVYNIMAQAKVTPVPVDPNLRPVSLTNMVFPTVAPAYPYLNQVRMDQPLQPMYQPLMEEQKLAPSPHNDTFRIDPSYQYLYPCGACAGACPEPHQHQHQRPYSVGYGQLEQQMLQQPYPVGNVLLQHNVQHYPYPDAMQWGSPMIPGAPPKLLMHELCPVYPQYPYMYPQMIPQPYPIVQPIYPTLDKDRRPRRAHTLPTSQRTTPQPRDRDSEIALKIQQVQIKEQMAQLNTQDKEKSGNGLLGNAPPNYNGRVGRGAGAGAARGDPQLSSAARAIVNSIRNMQAHAHTSQHDARRHAAEGSRERDDKRRPHTQMSPGNWCRRSPGPVHPALNHPRRPHPDTRNGRR